QPPARLNQRAVGVLLLRSHLIVGDLDIASESRRAGHGAVSCAETLRWREEALRLTRASGLGNALAHGEADADARIDQPNAAGDPRPRPIGEEQVLRHDTAIEP